MNKKLHVRWHRNAAKVMRGRLRDAGVRVSEVEGGVSARLEMVVEADGKTVRVPVPAGYWLLAPRDLDEVAGDPE